MVIFERKNKNRKKRKSKNKKNKKEKNNFFSRKKNLLISSFLFSFILGIFFIQILPRVFATQSVSITVTSDNDFNKGTFNNTTTEGSGDDANLILSPSQSNGSWISSSSSDVIDLIFNGGWGDGNNDSIAFEANVEDVDSDHTISFEMRVASTLNGLLTAQWKSLGTVNSGNYFSKTREELLTLGLEEGTNRYVQIRITLSSSDGVNTPRLNDFKIWHLKDNDPPEALNLVSALNEEGGSIELLSGGWYNYAHPYFEWTATDNCNPSPGCGSGVNPCCSGIAGYWVYFGTDPTADPELEGIQTTNNYYIADNLISGSIYYLRIKPYDFTGNKLSNSSIENIFTYQYDSIPPSSPGYILTPPGFVNTKKFVFTWPVPPNTDAASDEHSGIDGYQYKINNCPWYGPNHIGSIEDFFTSEEGYYETTEDYDFECLREGANYIYIRSKDTAGNFSDEYATGVVRINTTAPGPPRNLTVSPSSSSKNSFSFSWDPPLNPPAPITEYHYSINSLPTETNHFTTTNDFLPVSSYATLKGLNTFYVVAVAEGGAVNYENYASISFYCDSPVPSPPRNIEIFDNSIRETKTYKIGLSWNEPLVKGNDFAGYKIYRSTVEGASCSKNLSDFQEIATTTSTGYIDSNLQSRRYYYCVRAFNNINEYSAPSDTVSLVPTGRWKTPPNLTKEPTVSAGVKTATITWFTDRKSSSFIRYGTKSNVYKTEVGSSDKVLYHSVRLSGLEPNTTYYFRAVWIDEDGNEGISQEYSFTTKPAPKLYNTEILEVSLDSAYLQFTSSNAVQAKVYYGKNTSYGGFLIIATSFRKSTYTLKFLNLDDDTLYHYMIELYDEEGNKYQFEDHTFKTLPRPRILNVQIQQIFDRPSPTLEVIYESNTEISSVLRYYPEKNPTEIGEVVDLKFKTHHKLEISGLKDNTVYLLKIGGYDKFGNEAESGIQRFTTATDTRPPNIFELSTNSIIKGRGSQAEAQIIVSWKTDEPSTSQVGFGYTSGLYDSYTILDENLRLEHQVVISGLKPATIYHIKAISLDGAGNKVTSEDIVVLTPKATESAIDLIFKSLKEVFGLH